MPARLRSSRTGRDTTRRQNQSLERTAARLRFGSALASGWSSCRPCHLSAAVRQFQRSTARASRLARVSWRRFPVLFFDFDADCSAVRLFCSQQCCAAAHEWVEYQVIFVHASTHEQLAPCGYWLLHGWPFSRRFPCASTHPPRFPFAGPVWVSAIREDGVPACESPFSASSTSRTHPREHMVWLWIRP